MVRSMSVVRMKSGNDMRKLKMQNKFISLHKEKGKMRLVTRSDFDGLACGALLLEAGIIDSWKFAHPKDLQDGLVEVNENDCLANVPYVEGCGLWFDHHSSEHERLELEGKYKGESRITPSCARIIYEYYGGKERFPQFDDLMEAVNRSFGSAGMDSYWIFDGSTNWPWKVAAVFDFKLSVDGKTDVSMPHDDNGGDSCASGCKGAC